MTFAVNPKTGQALLWDGKQWGDAPSAENDAGDKLVYNGKSWIAAPKPEEPSTFQDYVVTPAIQGKQNVDLTATDVGRRLGIFSPDEAATRNVEDFKELNDAQYSKKLQGKLDYIQQEGMTRPEDQNWYDAPGRSLAATAENPSTILPKIISSFVSSSPAIGASMIGAGLGGRAGQMAGMGLGSYATDYSSTMNEFFQSKGIDVTNAQALANAYKNPELMDEASDWANKHAIPVGVFDAISAGVAGKLFSALKAPAAATPLRKTVMGAAGTGAEMGMQGLLGAAGEAGGQIMQTGGIKDWTAVMDEAIGEIAPGMVEAMIGKTHDMGQQPGAAIPGVPNVPQPPSGPGGHNINQFINGVAPPSVPPSAPAPPAVPTATMGFNPVPGAPGSPGQGLGMNVQVPPPPAAPAPPPAAPPLPRGTQTVLPPEPKSDPFNPGIAPSHHLDPGQSQVLANGSNLLPFGTVTPAATTLRLSMVKQDVAEQATKQGIDPLQANRLGAAVSNAYRNLHMQYGVDPMALLKNYGPNIDQATEDLKKAALNHPPEKNNPGWRVYNQIYQQLVRTREPQQRAMAAAIIAQRYYEERGRRMGTDAETEFKKSNLAIYQLQGQGIRGQNQVATQGPPANRQFFHSIVSLFNGRSPTTFLHEMMHQWHNELLVYAQRADANEQDKADFQTLLRAANLTHDQSRNYTMDDFRGGPGANGDVNKSFMERFARGFEEYVASGQGPTPELTNLFQRFKEWIFQFFGRREYSAFMSPEIKNMFDRMLGAPESQPTTDRNSLGSRLEMQARVDAGRHPGRDSAEKVASSPLNFGSEGTSVPGYNDQNPTQTRNPLMDVQSSSREGDLTVGQVSQSPMSTIKNTWQAMFNPLAGLHNQNAYRVMKMLLRGTIGESEAFAKKLAQSLHNLPAAIEKQVFEYLTDRTLAPGHITDDKARAAAQQIKAKISQLSDMLLQRGMIDQNAHTQFKDQYLPRLYLKYVLEEKGLTGSGVKVGSQYYLRSRNNNLTPEDMARLGEIKNNEFLTFRAMFPQMRDMAVIDFLQDVAGAQGSNWIWQPSMAKWTIAGRPMNVTTYWLRDEAMGIRKRAELEPIDTQRQAMLKMATDMEHLATMTDQGMPQEGFDPKRFQRLPDSPKYGMLRGAVVAKPIYDDIVGTTGYVNNDNFFDRWFGNENSKLVRGVQMWKVSKVIMNPGTQVRNFVSNAVSLQLSGVPMWRVVPRLAQAAKAMASNGPAWQEAKRFGITSGTMTEAELRAANRLLAEVLEKKGAGFGGWRAAMKAIASLANNAGKAYQISEQLFKTASMIDSMAKGMSPADAALHANHYLLDYNEVHPWVRRARNAPLGVPFITYYYKMLPVVLETLLNPRTVHRFLPYAALAGVGPVQGLATMGAAALQGLDDNDVEKLKKALSEHVRKNGNLLLMPFKDANGRWQFVDVGYFFPWQMFNDFAKALGSGDVMGALSSAGLLSSPVSSVISAASTNVDPFTKKEIIDHRDPASLQALSWMKYVWGLAMPSVLTEYGAAGKLADKLYGTGVNRFGEPTNDNMQIFMRLLGTNITPVDPTAQRARNLAHMTFEISEIKRRLNYAMRDQSLTPEQQARTLERYRDHLIDKYKTLQKYAMDSAPTENLIRQSQKP